ncbi:MAG TPA: hypothetical protein VFZ00_20510 [Solirubrobacter sp.]|nr:hypothetical protein [Solirubrobacter sp.]
MSNPVEVLEQLHADAADLDTLTRRIYEATNELDHAEEAWNEAYDAVMQALEEEFAEAGRKSVPEHTALSAARRQHRALYVKYRNANRAVERLRAQLSAKRAAINGRQSELGALRDELRAMSEPPATQTYGRRVA